MRFILGSVSRNLKIINTERAFELFQSQSIRHNSNGVEKIKPFCLVEEFKAKPLKLKFFDNLKLTYKMKFIDSSFNIQEFLEGAKTAVIFISNKIAKGEFDALTDLVYPETLNKVKKGFNKLNTSEKGLIPVTQSNLFKIDLGDHDIRKNEDTWVYINTKSLILCSPKGLPKSLNEYIEFIHGPDAQQNILNASIADYTFVRKYSKEGASDWLITTLNHYNNSYLNNIKK